MNKPLVIAVALPDKCLNPNNAKRGAWFHKAKAGAKNTAKQRGHDAALEAMADAGISAPRWARATVRTVFYLRDKRGLDADGDNRLASLKGTLDGIALAGVVENDRGFRHEPIEHAIDRERPRVEITITPE